MASSIEYDAPQESALLWPRFAERISTGRERSLALMARVVLACFLSGYFLVYNDALHLGGLAIALVYLLPRAPWRSLGAELGADRLLWSVAHFLCWMTLRSFLTGLPTTFEGRREMCGWLFGVLMLGAFGVLVWIAAARPGNMRLPALVVGFSAAFAGALSIIVFYGILPTHMVGERLQNWFVYGGLNAVSTGLTLGFAGLWLATRWETLPVRLKRPVLAAMIVIHTAVLFTRCRGALAALAVGYLALLVCRGWRRTRFVLFVIVGVTVLFQTSAPVVSWLAEQKWQWTHPVAVIDQNVVGFAETYSNPAQELVVRKDSGRFTIYRAAWQSLQGVQWHMFGLGEWGTDSLWRSRLPSSPEHMHSALLATYVHGGWVGCGLLLMVLFLGFQRAASLAKRVGDDQWLILLIYGCASVTFDGQTFTSLASVPQFESLLVWLPLFACASAWSHMKRVAA